MPDRPRQPPTETQDGTDVTLSPDADNSGDCHEIHNLRPATDHRSPSEAQHRRVSGDSDRCRPQCAASSPGGIEQRGAQQTQSSEGPVERPPAPPLQRDSEGWYKFG